MASVNITGLTKRFGGSSSADVTVIDDLHLDIADGELLVLLGASGCGKTTTLRCLAGLESPSEGTISMGEHTVYDAHRKVEVPTEKRSIGMVFQSYALWPHMTVRKNIAYPLKVRKIREGLNEGWVEEVAAMVDCGHLLDRYPGQLSGGQQQRVALARGLVARPDLVLFDEPLSNLDAKLRGQVRAELHSLHRRLGFTSVFVTHDQDEALALADRIAIMRAGRIEQCATPQEIFEEPATDYVAEFIGMSNRVPFTRTDEGWTVGDAGVAIRLPLERAVGDVIARVRPDDLRLGGAVAQLPAGAPRITAVVTDVVYGGRHVDVGLAVDGARLSARVSTVDAPRPDQIGQPVDVGFDPSDGRYFDADRTTSVSRLNGHEALA